MIDENMPEGLVVCINRRTGQDTGEVKCVGEKTLNTLLEAQPNAYKSKI
jgi:hypothetical protein